MYGVAKRGNPGDFFGECGRAFGLRSATGSLGLTSVDGSLESSPVRPGCYLSIYLSIYLDPTYMGGMGGVLRARVRSAFGDG